MSEPKGKVSIRRGASALTSEEIRRMVKDLSGRGDRPTHYVGIMDPEFVTYMSKALERRVRRLRRALASTKALLASWQGRQP